VLHQAVEGELGLVIHVDLHGLYKRKKERKKEEKRIERIYGYQHEDGEPRAAVRMLRRRRAMTLCRKTPSQLLRAAGSGRKPAVCVSRSFEIAEARLASDHTRRTRADHLLSSFPAAKRDCALGLVFFFLAAGGGTRKRKRKTIARALRSITQKVNAGEMKSVS
jgi:hypothetical protein